MVPVEISIQITELFLLKKKCKKKQKKKLFTVAPHLAKSKHTSIYSRCAHIKAITVVSFLNTASPWLDMQVISNLEHAEKLVVQYCVGCYGKMTNKNELV